ncbi:MAG: hypothetical protein HBSAPP03_17400 [Phycisphaerae bacterium]|nr:MAG: hypothetical protein HBSAPP03_17400 [Phycisphaerae bacterium]
MARVLFYDLCRMASHVILRVFFGLRVRGLERVPQTGPLLIAANHASYLDPPAVGVAIRNRHLTFIAQAGLFKFKPFAWLISTLNSVPVRGDAGDSAAMKAALARLAAGGAVLIFPEGSRSDDGTIRPFKRGVALLMKKARCPVLPVAIDGAYEAWPNSRMLPRPFGRPVRVLYGTPIPEAELLKDGAEAGLARIERDVRALAEQLRAERAAHRAAETRPTTAR